MWGYERNFGVPIRNMSPYAGGQTLSQQASSTNPSIAFNTAKQTRTVEENNPVVNASEVGKKGSPFIVWMVLAILLVAGGLFAQGFGDKSEFGDVRLSFYNVVMITLVAIVGLSGAKFLVTRFPIPGLSSVVLAL